MNKVHENKEVVPLTAQPWFIFLAFVFFSPVGLYFMWKHRLYSRAIRQIITSLSLATFLLLIANLFWGDLEVPESAQTKIEKVAK